MAAEKENAFHQGTTGRNYPTRKGSKRMRKQVAQQDAKARRRENREAPISEKKAA